MFKHARDVVAGDYVIRAGYIRKVEKAELIGGGKGVMMTFESRPEGHRVETFKLDQTLEVTTPYVEVPKTDLEKNRETLAEQGFEPGRWWKATVNGKILAETSNPAEFKALGLIGEPGVTIHRIYARTENVWVEEEPDV